MHHILVVDHTPYRNALTALMENAGYRVDSSDSAIDAIARLSASPVDLVISEIELPGDNAFALYNYIGEHFPYIPTIMTASGDIDRFFEKILSEGIGNVLAKPLHKEDILHLAEKLITRKNIFGLENYLMGVAELKKIRITKSSQIQKAIELLFDEIEGWGHHIENKMILTLVLNEMVINAVYHSHGFTREKEQRKPISLPEGKYVDLFTAHNGSRYGISITDYNGKLTKQKILASINKVVDQNNLILRAAQTGEDISSKISETGRGIDMVRKLTREYYFIIKENVRTEIMLIFADASDTGTEDCSSIKIIEDISNCE